MRIARLIPCGLLALMALFWLPSGSGAQGAGGPTCGCTKQDKIDLESRIKQTKAAVDEYDRLVNEWVGKEKSAGHPILLGDTTFTVRDLESFAEVEMIKVKDPKARSFPAKTDPACDSTFDPAATPCLLGALQDHEKVHKDVCDKTKSLNPFKNVRKSQRVVDIIKEDQKGYRKEWERLTNELDKLQKDCKQLTQLDKSAQQQLQQFLAQRERVGSANKRLQMYGKALN